MILRVFLLKNKEILIPRSNHDGGEGGGGALGFIFAGYVPLASEPLPITGLFCGQL